MYSGVQFTSINVVVSSRAICRSSEELRSVSSSVSHFWGSPFLTYLVSVALNLALLPLSLDAAPRRGLIVALFGIVVMLPSTITI